MSREFKVKKDDAGFLTHWISKETNPARTVKIPDTIHTIGEGAFSSCRETLTEVTIPKTVTNIMFGAFSHCTKLADLHFPDSQLCIGALAFYFCEGLKKELVFPQDVTIKAGSFNSCTNLPSVQYKGSHVVHPTAFQWCEELKEAASNSEDDEDLEVITDEELVQANAASQMFLNRQRDRMTGNGNDPTFTKSLATPP